jgi:hypothetical protein
MLHILQAIAGFIAGFAVGLGLLAAAFTLARDALSAEVAMPLGVIVLWGSATVGSWLALG